MRQSKLTAFFGRRGGGNRRGESVGTAVERSSGDGEDAGRGRRAHARPGRVSRRQEEEVGRRTRHGTGGDGFGRQRRQVGVAHVTDGTGRMRHGRPSRRRTARVTRDYNLAFYQNRIPLPTGPNIDAIHVKWLGKYGLLESKHDFIQWLFPTLTASMFNGASRPLTRPEAQAMREDVDVGRRLVQSYRLMLDFYGMQLVNERTGEVARAKHHKKRYLYALIRSSHNHLRVARILSSLTALGFRRYALRLLQHLLNEIERGDLQQLAYSRCPRMWATYGNTKSRDFARYCQVLESEIVTSAYLDSLSRKSHSGEKEDEGAQRTGSIGDADDDKGASQKGKEVPRHGQHLRHNASPQSAESTALPAPTTSAEPTASPALAEPTASPAPTEPTASAAPMTSASLSRGDSALHRDGVSRAAPSVSSTRTADTTIPSRSMDADVAGNATSEGKHAHYIPPHDEHKAEGKSDAGAGGGQATAGVPAAPEDASSMPRFDRGMAEDGDGEAALPYTHAATAVAGNGGGADDGSDTDDAPM